MMKELVVEFPGEGVAKRDGQISELLIFTPVHPTTHYHPLQSGHKLKTSLRGLVIMISF